MNIKCEDYDHVSVIGITGELAADSSEILRQQVQDRFDRRINFFVLDLEFATFIDSQGLDTLLWLQEQCEERLGHVRLCKPDDTCTKILQVTRLDSRFDVFADVAEAVKTMR